MNVAITGNIGSGKSSFCSYLEELGCTVHYADLIANDMLPQIADILKKRWGDDVFYGSVANRQRIAQIVFDRPQELEFLNANLHPLVVAEIDRILAKTHIKTGYFEIPLLFEANLQDRFDFIVLVRSPIELVADRLKLRNPDNWENQIKRLERQIPDSQKAALVDLIIENDASTDKLRKAARDLVEELG